MLHYRRIQREDKEVVQFTCNKCGAVYQKNVAHPDFTTIANNYGFGSKKDGDKYVSHICEPCMDEFYATFAVPPQIISAIVWGEDPGDPVRFVDDPITTEPVAPVVEDPHAPQEETP